MLEAQQLSLTLPPHRNHGLFADHYLDHARLTAEIVRLETNFNAHVYALFALTNDEIALIEASTKYRYGEV